MKRILILSLTYTPFIGGAEIAVKEITDRLRLRDVSFDMITLRFDKNLPEVEKIGNVTIHRIGFGKKNVATSDTYKFPLSVNKYIFPFLAYRKARKLHAKNFYDIIWSIQANYAGFAALFTKNALPHVPFVLTLQEGDPIDHYLRRVGMLQPIFQNIFRRADVIQVISEFLGGYAKTMGYTGPISVIPNGVDVATFAKRPAEKELSILKQRMMKKSDDVYLITISRLVKKNAVDDIISALTHLPKNYKLIVAGEGPDGKTLWNLAKDLGVEKRIMFLGHVPHNELPLYLHVSDIFVRPSRSEGMGNVFIESMAAGVPVIGTPVGGITDFLFDPEKTKLGKVTPTGLFCSADNPKSIAKTVERLSSDTKLRKNIIANAYAMVREKYDWKKISTDMYTDVFDKALATRHTVR